MWPKLDLSPHRLMQRRGHKHWLLLWPPWVECMTPRGFCIVLDQRWSITICWGGLFVPWNVLASSSLSEFSENFLSKKACWRKPILFFCRLFLVAENRLMQKALRQLARGRKLILLCVFLRSPTCRFFDQARMTLPGALGPPTGTLLSPYKCFMAVGWI